MVYEIQCEICNDTGRVGERCPACDGSGEGMADGTTCYRCRGAGEIGVACDCGHKPPEPDIP
jgi:hypothetical protein